jgi:hypothetical protein
VDVVRGVVLHCSRFGAVVRLDDGRLALLPAERAGMSAMRRASAGGKRPQFPFVVEAQRGKHVRLALANVADGEEDEREDDREVPARTSSSFEQKIIDYLRQTSEWDSRIATGETPRGEEHGRPDRLLPFEYRARSQYRDSPRRPRRPKR